MGRALSLALAIALLAAPARAAEERMSAGAASGLLDLRPEFALFGWIYEGTFRSPSAVHCDVATGEIYVADRSTNLIGVFDANGVPLFTFRDQQLHEPRDLTVDRSGRIFVLDNDVKHVKVYSARGERLPDLQLPPLESIPGFTAIALDREGNLFLGDSKNGQVLVFDPRLKLKMRLRSSAPKPFSFISGIAFDAQHIYVADQDNLAIQVFDRVGRYVRGWGEHDAGIPNVSLPHGIAIDAKGRVVLIDTMRQEIKFFEPDGDFLDRFGGIGSAPGQVRYPTDACIDASGRLWVADAANARVQALSIVESVPPAAKAEGEESSDTAADAAPRSN